MFEERKDRTLAYMYVRNPGNECFELGDVALFGNLDDKIGPVYDYGEWTVMWYFVREALIHGKVLGGYELV